MSPRGELLHDDVPRLDVAGVDEVIGLHRQTHLRLAFSVGETGWAHLLGDPQALVSELLRLARIGAIAEAEARRDGKKPIRLVVDEARRRWRLELGGR